jgi:hypothetical protein
MKELQQIYNKRKQQLVPLILGFAAFFVLVRVILPQWTDITDVQSLVTTKRAAIEAKTETVRILNSLTSEKIDEDYTLVTTALPLRKDIVLIYSELNDVANRSGVELGGFSVKIGDIYTTAKSTKSSDQTINGIPYFTILVNVSGESDGMRKFADLMYESLPVVEISTIDISKRDARYTINFFFKPLSLKPDNASATAIQPLSAADTKQLDAIRTWKSDFTPLY